MQTRVLLLRHAEAANPLIFHGAESDVGLSERGLRQADAAAPFLAAIQPDRIISSGMRRALETAGPTARACGLPIVVEKALHERRVGALCGTPTHGSEGVWPDTLRRWQAGDTGFAPDGAESYDAIRDRVLPVWERITIAAAGQTLLVVAHGIVCKVVLLTVLPGYSVADWARLGPIHNLAINELLCEEGHWRALRLNDVPAAVAGV